MSAPEDLRDWAAAYRQARRPPGGLAERIRAAVHSEHEQEPEPLGDDEPPTPAAPSQRWGLGLAIGAMVGVAALLLLSWMVRWVRPQLDPSGTLQQAPFEQPSESGLPTTIHSPEAPPGPAEPAHPASDPAPPGAPGAMPVAPSRPLDRPRHPGRPDADRSQPPAPDPIDDGAVSAPIPGSSADLRSARQLRQAERMLADRPGAAMALLETHARDNPRSALSLEREALWIRAACQVGGAPRLAKRRAAFARRADVAAYRAAIARDCDRSQ